jgi:1-acyl-sn-glycerol-3-phosphate acyltransferase
VSRARRLVTVPAVLAAAALASAVAPLALAMTLALDLARGPRRRRFATTRFLGFCLAYLAGEVVGLLALALTWALARGDRARLATSTLAVQRAWVGALLGAVRRLYALRLEVEGEAALGAGPVVVFVRHTSLIDTLLPTELLTRRRGLRLRWVLKRELLLDPVLDLAGHRLPNAFVGRDGADTAGARAAVRALATDLAPDEGLLLYPEGTRFTPERRARALARLDREDPAFAARARRLARVLPPRPGGALAALEGAPDADVVVLGHVGLEGLATLGALLSGDLVGRTLRVRAWRYPRSEVPADAAGQLEWLRARWEALDRWVVEQEEAR